MPEYLAKKTGSRVLSAMTTHIQNQTFALVYLRRHLLLTNVQTHLETGMNRQMEYIITVIGTAVILIVQSTETHISAKKARRQIKRAAFVGEAQHQVIIEFAKILNTHYFLLP